MVLVPVRYSFTQKFSVPVEEAFRWAVDYDPADFSLIGFEGRRKVNKLSEDTFILDDARMTDAGWVEKRRLVRINPERRSFTNTHIGGSTLHSQFWYEFFHEGKGKSRLEFTGLLLYPSEKELPSGEVAKMAAAERKGDSQIWKNLAKAMEADLKKPSRTRR
ncbi:MAG TPA: hypothetical protein VND40_02560 [Nitrososphaerales archaeon]|nr:hypothetical protein [Nitrososphaerales archaeon]